MTCPKCNGKIKVIDSAHNTDDNEMYRRRKCLECGHTFYTTEFEVAGDDNKFRNAWLKYHRNNKNNW
jgi:transcriptional regulator NrdR family protein